MSCIAGASLVLSLLLTRHPCWSDRGLSWRNLDHIKRTKRSQGRFLPLSRSDHFGRRSPSATLSCTLASRTHHLNCVASPADVAPVSSPPASPVQAERTVCGGQRQKKARHVQDLGERIQHPPGPVAHKHAPSLESGQLLPPPPPTPPCCLVNFISVVFRLLRFGV